MTGTSGSASASLRGSGFGPLWTSSGAANLGDGLLLAGLPVLATTVTDSPAAIAGVMVALMVPLVLSALPSGVIADRADRRRILIAGNHARAAGILLLLVLVALFGVQLASIYAVAFVAASSEMLVDTTAQATVPGLVPDARLDGANARLVTTQLVNNEAVGAPLGAALATFGAAALLGPSVLLYAVAGLAAARLRTAAPADRPAAADGRRAALARVRSDVREGLQYVARDAVLLRLALAASLSNLGNVAYFGVFVVFVVGPLGLPAAAYGILLAAVAVGGLLGGGVAERVLRRTGPAAGIRGALGVLAVAYAVLAMVRDVVVVGLAVASIGGAAMLLNVAGRTLRQRLAPPALLGRVSASIMMVAMVSAPIGALIGGGIAEWLGVRAVGWFAAATSVLTLLVVAPVTADVIRDARAAVTDGSASG